MAFIRADFYAASLGMQTGIHVILPEGAGKNDELRVLYLLHGLSDNCTNWVRGTSIERYALQYNTAVVMPEVQRSFYTDMRYGPQYFAYVTEELPRFCQKTFAFSGEREKTFVAGLSMGGYGALKCALTYPERYAYCAAFSSACDIRLRTSLPEMDEQLTRDAKAIFGEQIHIPEEADLHLLAEKNAKAPALPKLYLTCGLQDGLLPENRAIAERLQRLGYGIRYEEWEGVHNWEFWDTSILKAFRYFFGQKESGVVAPIAKKP